MYTFPQLLLRNSILEIIFIVFISTVSLSMLSSALEENSAEHRQLISVLTKQLDSTNNEVALAKNIAETLQEVSSYNVLKITNQSGKNLFSYVNANIGLTLPLNSPSSTKYTVERLKITIEYKLSFLKEYTLMARFLLLSISLSFMLTVFATLMSAKRHKAVLNNVSQQINSELALVNLTNKSDIEEVSSDNKALEIPELKQGIKDIKNLISQQLENTTLLEQEAYIDPLTKFDNRNRFVQFYENQIVLDKSVKFGVLIITRCSELQTINKIRGYNEGDNYITQVAQLIKSSLASYSNSHVFRLNSSDFACILPNIELKEAERFTNNLTHLFTEYQQTADLDSVAYSGLVTFDKSELLGELLALADTGVSIAQTQNPNAWYSQKNNDLLQNNNSHYGNQNWRQEIDNVLDNQRVSLLLQPIQPNGKNTKIYGEILARFLNSNNDTLPTASFIAMAEKLDKIVAVDKIVIEKTISEITAKNLFNQSFGINISARSIRDEHFLIWLERKLLREPKIAPLLVFEIAEYGLQQNIRTSKRLVEMLHRVGSRITVERFGVGLTSFKFFRELTPDYIKMDSSYTRGIDDDKNNQYFLRLMVDLAHRLSIYVLVESIETQEEKHTLEKLFIDGCQGFHIGKPAPL